MRLFITGGAGYVGAMLADQFSSRPDVEKILLLDKSEKPELLNGKNNIEWITSNTADSDWEAKAMEFQPDVVIHTAWQIREMFGDQDTQWTWNVEGSAKVFDFAFKCPSVKKLIYFSTASIYGAFATNTIEHRYKESEPLLEDEYLYGVEKKKVEEILKEKYEEHVNKGSRVPQIFMVRPAAITGPRGRYMMKSRFGLQSALSGRLSGSFIYSIIKLLVTVVPATKLWCRQFIHEDDVADIMELLAFKDLQGKYEIFNITPPGPVVLAKDMARVVGKKMVTLPPWVIRIGFFFARNLSFGKIPTSKGGWKFYAYPIVMDGTKITQQYGYNYKYESLDAFSKIEGRYAKYVSDEDKKAAEAVMAASNLK